MKSWFFALVAAVTLLVPRTLLASCKVLTAPGAVPVNPALQGAVFTSLGFIVVMLGSCAVVGIVLYRRSIAPRLPHHDLIEELENYDEKVSSC